MMRAIVLLVAMLGWLAAWGAEEADSLEAQPFYLLVGEAEEAAAQGRTDEAAARLVEAMAVDPDNPLNPLLLSNLGVLYRRAGRDSMALAVLDEGVRRAPAMLTLRLHRARLHLHLGHNREALADLDAAVDIDSADCTARYYRGTMALYGGQLALAEADFEVLRRQQPKGLDTAVALSALYSLSGRDRQAIPYFERLVADDPAPEYYAGLAGCLLAVEDYSRAAEVLGAALERYSKDAELWYYRAVLNRKRYRTDDARSDAERALQLGANPARVKEIFE